MLQTPVRRFAAIVLVIGLAVAIWKSWPEREETFAAHALGPHAELAGDVEHRVKPAPKPTDDRPLADHQPRAATELVGVPGTIALPAGEVPTLTWQARDARAPVVMMVPGVTERAINWQAAVQRVADVLDAHMMAWDAPRLHGLASNGDVKAALALVRQRWPDAAQVAILAAGEGLDRTLADGAAQDGLIVVSLRGVVRSEPGKQAFSQPSLPWSLLVVGAVTDASARPWPSLPDAMMRRQLDAPVGLSPIGMMIDDRVTPKLLGWLFPLLGGG